MIYSSADILNALGSDAVIRQEARLSIVDGRPGLGFDEYVYIYIDKYPTVDEYEATWRIWVVDGGSSLYDVVITTIKRSLPNVTLNGDHYTTTDFASDKTVVKTEAEIQLEETREERARLQKQFRGISETLQAQASAVRDGIDGKDGRDGVDGLPGKDGRDGRDGRDGKDLIATEAELFDLQDVDSSGVALERGQVLTWDGVKWTNLFVRQSYSPGGVALGDGGTGGGGGTAGVTQIIAGDNVTVDPVDGTGVVTINAEPGGAQLLDDLQDVSASGAANGQFLQYNSTANEWQPVTITPGSGIEEAPQDGDYYVRQNGAWINLQTALAALGIGGSGIGTSDTLDGGDFTSGLGGDTSFTLDAGNFNNGSASGTGDTTADGGEFT